MQLPRGIKLQDAGTGRDRKFCPDEFALRQIKIDLYDFREIRATRTTGSATEKIPEMRRLDLYVSLKEASKKGGSP